MPVSTEPLTKRVFVGIVTLFGMAVVLSMAAGLIYGAWNLQMWQYEWATGCSRDHGGLSRTEWAIGMRPVNDCRPWWAILLFEEIF